MTDPDPPAAPDPFADDEARWSAVLARDARADGAFVYAVRTTLVHCRPSCPARRPLRRNVVFFATPADAAAAGFRACRRCGSGRPPLTRLAALATLSLNGRGKRTPP